MCGICFQDILHPPEKSKVIIKLHASAVKEGKSWRGLSLLSTHVPITLFHVRAYLKIVPTLF